MSIYYVANVGEYFGVKSSKNNSTARPTIAGQNVSPNINASSIPSLKPIGKAQGPYGTYTMYEVPISFLESIKNTVLHRQERIAINEKSLAATERKREEWLKKAAENTGIIKKSLEDLIPYIDMTINDLKETIRTEKVSVPRDLRQIEGRLAQAHRKAAEQKAATISPSFPTVSLPTVDALNLREEAKPSTYHSPDAKLDFQQNEIEDLV